MKRTDAMAGLLGLIILSIGCEPASDDEAEGTPDAPEAAAAAYCISPYANWEDQPPQPEYLALVRSHMQQQLEYAAYTANKSGFEKGYFETPAGGLQVKGSILYQVFEGPKGTGVIAGHVCKDPELGTLSACELVPMFGKLASAWYGSGHGLPREIARGDSHNICGKKGWRLVQPFGGDCTAVDYYACLYGGEDPSKQRVTWIENH
jgi:hypothetical protein